MQNSDVIFDPKRYEIFTIDGMDDYYMDGDELIMLVTDVMQTANTLSESYWVNVLKNRAEADVSYTMEDYPVIVDEAIEFLEVILGFDVHQFEEEDYARLDAAGLVH